MTSSNKQSVFASAALTSGLVSQDQIDEAISTVYETQSAGVSGVTDEQLASQLVQMGSLTPYQAQQLKGGRTKLNLGPYLVTDWIGQGGMGMVFKAEHIMMGRQVAIKVLPRHKSTPAAIEGFTREIRAQAKLDHRNLVRAYDAGHDGNAYYLVTEFVEGTDLRRLVRSQGRLLVQQAASILMQSALGLSHAHQRNLIHRDVKPGNILVTKDGVTKVSDLGLAGYLNERDLDPRAGKIVGTADYLSPEQIKTPREVTVSSDIYSLGCTLYYAVTGKVPFPGGKTLDKVRRHCTDTPWHPRRFNPDISDEFVDIIADMMEKDVRDRIPSAAEVATRLEPWATDAEVPIQHPTHSPWLPPPVPTGAEDTAVDLLGSEHSIHGSESESSVAESKAVPRLPIADSAPPIPVDFPSGKSSQSVILALSIAIPFSMLVGVLLAAFVFWMLG